MNDLTMTDAKNFCVDDFMKSYKLACDAAGGRSSSISDAQLLHLANILAPNGIRFTYAIGRTIENVERKLQFGKKK